MIPAFLLTPLGKKIGIAVLGVVLLSGATAVIYQKGKAAGYGDGQRAQLEDDKKLLDQQTQTFQDSLKRAQSQVQAANAQIEAANARSAILAKAIAATSQMRQQAQEKVSALADKDLFADIVGKLAVRATNDPTPNFTFSELRKIDATVTDYPPLKTQYEQLAARQAETENAVRGLNDKVDGITKQRDAAITYSNQLMAHYVDAYNAAQKRPPLIVKVLTLGLYHGKHMDLPSPVSLEATMPKAGL